MKIKTHTPHNNVAKTPRHRYPVSEKVYADLTGRIRGGLKACGDERLTDDAIRIFDIYLNTRILPDNLDGTIRIILFILRPEIDRAIARSARARMRTAAKRQTLNCTKEKSGNESCTPKPNDVEPKISAQTIDERIHELVTKICSDSAMMEDEEESGIEPILNRRQRRLMEQERKREARRAARRRV